jgi:hypothetical protein
MEKKQIGMTNFSELPPVAKEILAGLYSKMHRKEEGKPYPGPLPKKTGNLLRGSVSTNVEHRIFKITHYISPIDESLLMSDKPLNVFTDRENHKDSVSRTLLLRGTRIESAVKIRVSDGKLLEFSLNEQINFLGKMADIKFDSVSMTNLFPGSI